MIEKYLGKLSGPLLDRIDLHVHVASLSYDEVKSTEIKEKTSAEIKVSVDSAREFSRQRQGETPNGLLSPDQIEKYLTIAHRSINGYMTIGTFSENGPTKCSGLEIKKYSEEELTTELKNGFEKIRCITEDHTTPFNTKQNFLFCSFKRK